MKNASPTGACRICLVEVEGARTLVASCATPAAPRMVVRTDTPRVLNARRLNIELLLASGTHDCLVCEANGQCKLQDLAYLCGSPQNYPTEGENPFILRDFSRCVLCGRCVQACNDVVVNRAISYGYRGSKSKIVAAGDRALQESECVFCGECVQACPVGALTEKQAKGKGRAWELAKVRTTCSYCGVGCQLNLHVRKDKIVKVTGVEDVGPNFGSLCVKGRFGYDFVDDPGRLKTPLIRDNGSFREASWDEALDLVAEKLKGMKSRHGADAIGVLSSARITNEENYLVQKFARAVVGTNNIDHCARL